MDSFLALVWKEGDTFVSRLEGTDISSYGETTEEAMANLKEAVELYFEDMPEDEKQEILESALSASSSRENAQTFPLSIEQ